MNIAENARKTAEAMGMNYIGCVDGSAGEFLPTSADKPITVNGIVLGSKRNDIKTARVVASNGVVGGKLAKASF